MFHMPSGALPASEHVKYVVPVVFEAGDQLIVTNKFCTAFLEVRGTSQ